MTYPIQTFHDDYHDFTSPQNFSRGDRESLGIASTILNPVNTCIQVAKYGSMAISVISLATCVLTSSTFLCVISAISFIASTIICYPLHVVHDFTDLFSRNIDHILREDRIITSSAREMVNKVFDLIEFVMGCFNCIIPTEYQEMYQEANTRITAELDGEPVEMTPELVRLHGELEQLPSEERFQALRDGLQRLEDDRSPSPMRRSLNADSTGW